MYELFFNQFSDNLLVNVVSSESPVAKDLVQDYKNHGQEYLFGGPTRSNPTTPSSETKGNFLLHFLCVFKILLTDRVIGILLKIIAINGKIYSSQYFTT